MGKIDELIQQYCPEGVEYVRLGDCIKSLNTGLNPRQFFKLNTDDATNYYITIRELQNNTIVVNDKTDRLNDEALRLCNNRSNLEKGDVLFSGTGTIGEVAVIEDTPTNRNIKEGVYAIKPDPSIINYKFLMYLLQSTTIRKEYLKKAEGGTVKSVSMGEMRKLEIPLPPLPVQKEIVRILDNFTNLAAELQAELQARQQQYNYYRDTLLSFEGRDDVQWKEYTLGELGNVVRGNGLQKKDFTETGVGCIHYGQIYTKYGSFTDKTFTYVDEDLASHLLQVEKGNLVIACTSENVEDICKCVAWLGEENICTGGHSCVYRHNQNPKYMAYFFQTDNFFKQKKKYVYGTKVKDIKPTDIEKIIIPLPSLEEQERIVSILDNLYNLVNDLSQGLPAEIEARQQQYEYYRDQLLTFKRKEA